MKHGVAAACIASLLAGSAAASSPECASTDGIDAGPRLRQWLALRQEKCAHLEPYKPTFVESQILAFEKAERPPITELNLFGLYPRIQSIDHRSQYAAGVRLWRPDVSGSSIDVSGAAFWSLQGYQYFDAQIGAMPHLARSFPLVAARSDDVFELPNVRESDDRRYMLYGSFLYRWAPKYDFYGVGPDSQHADQSAFRLKERLVEGVAGYRVLPRLSLSARVGYDIASTGDSDDDELPQLEETFAPEEVPGLGQHPDFLRGTLSAVFDSRDVAKNPHRGAVVAAQWERYDQRGGTSDASFDRVAGDARLYLTLGHPQRVLALRAYASQDAPTAGGRVPFYFLEYLGSSHTLRAFDSQRFRGERLALVQAEYRWEASPALELAAFVDSGAVAATRDDALGSFRTDGGLGLRVKTHETTMLRFDFAWGGEGFRFLFRFSPSF